MRWGLRTSTGKQAAKNDFLDKLAAEDNPKLRKMMEARAAREAGGAPSKPQEPAPILFPDLYWIWSAFCFLSERRGVSANGPVPITIEAMNAYAQMTNRYHQPYLSQLLHFIPFLDREYLRDFYEKQRKELEKQRKQAETKGRPTRGRVGKR